jgi:lysophospholipase L1-like esterase
MRSVLLVVTLSAVAAACGGSPTGPTDPPRSPRISRTQFLAFGDSFTAGEVSNPITGQFGVVSAEWGVETLLTISHSPLPTKQIVVPSASYPTVLQSHLRTTYTNQATTINVINAGEPNERILDGAQRFPGIYDATRPEVVLLMEGVNGLPGVGPDISAGVMRIMVQHAKAGGSRVFVGSMLPQVPGRPRGNTPTSELLAYNVTLRLMSQQEGIVFVDLYTAMLADAATLLGSDGLHPTEAGYRRIAELFFAAIRNDLEER